MLSERRLRFYQQHRLSRRHQGQSRTQVVIVNSAFIVEAVWAEYIRVGKDTPRQISAVYGRWWWSVAGQYRDSGP
jgi:hypothetical protein